MAEKTYVHIDKFGVKALGKNIKALAGDKVKKVAIAAMDKAARKAIEKSSLLTTKPTNEKKGTALHVGCSLAALELAKAGDQTLLACKISMVAGDYDLKSKKGKMQLFPSGGAKYPVDKPDDAGAVVRDTATLLDTIVGDLVTKQLVKQLEIKAKAFAKDKKAKAKK